MEPTAAIEDFFRQFEYASRTADGERAASLFSDSFLMADPEGVKVVQASQLKAAIEQRRKMFQNLGHLSTALDTIQTTFLDENYALVKTRWIFQFAAGNGVKEVGVPASYIVALIGPVPEIVFYLNHESLLAVLKRNGIIQSPASGICNENLDEVILQHTLSLLPCISLSQENTMATSNNPFVPLPKTEIDEPEDHQHEVPIVNIEDRDREDRETLEYEPPENLAIEREEEVLLELDEADALFGKRSGVKDDHGRY